MFVDLHDHVLPFIDDGASDIDTALQMLKIAEEDGIRHIIATPHYIHGELGNTSAIVYERCSELSEFVENEKINIKIYPGNEIFISPEVPKLVEEGHICTLNNSMYALIELPMMSMPEYASDVFYQLKLNGYTPIIAHPERNRVIAGNPNLLYDFILSGALSQVNASSLTGLYGTGTKEAAVTILRHGMAHFISSDAHTCRGRSPKLGKAYDFVMHEMGEETANSIFCLNGIAVLSNESIEIEEPQRMKRQSSFFSPLLAMLRK